MNAQEVIAQALALSKAATDGPWHHEPYGGQNQNGDYAGGNVFDADGEYVVSDVSDADGALMAAARTLLPAFAKALGDVLDEHTERPNSTSAMYPVPLCSCGEEYPTCPTRAAITAALSEVTE